MSMTVPFAAQVVHGADAAVVRLTGELDLVTAPRLRTTIEDLVDVHLRSITIDLAQLTFCDVAGIRSLDQAREFADLVGARLSVIGVSRALLGAMTVLGFDLLLGCVDQSSRPDD
jgi:anti-anti-sigma factor